MSIRPGRYYTLAAACLIVATGIALERTATAALPAVRPTVLTGVVLGLGFLLIGSASWVGVASLPMIGAIMFESGFGDEPSWVRAIVIGCLWFVALEMSWEAIERRSGSTYTRASGATRVREVATVVGVALVLGIFAAAATEFAPARSVLVQAIVLGSLLGALASAIRGTASRAQTIGAGDAATDRS